MTSEDINALLQSCQIFTTSKKYFKQKLQRLMNVQFMVVKYFLYSMYLIIRYTPHFSFTYKTVSQDQLEISAEVCFKSAVYLVCFSTLTSSSSVILVRLLIKQTGIDLIAVFLYMCPKSDYCQQQHTKESNTFYITVLFIFI